MKKAVMAVFFFSALRGGVHALETPLRFEKISDHCYYLQLKSGEENVAAVVTDEGILVVDPPSEPDLAPMVAALKRLSSKPVRWVVFSGPRSACSGGGRFFAEQGAMLLGGTKLRAIANSLPPTDAAGGSWDLSSFPWILFDSRIHLFPSNIEIRIMAIQQKAITGGDVIVHIPAEKVVVAGRMYEPASYPEIDTDARGDAGEWVDGLKQVIDSIPVLKPAIPQSKIDPKTDPGKTLEEGIIVLPSRGAISNLQNMKDLLSACQRLRADIAKAVRAGRSCENFINSSRADIYRDYANFSDYATQLCGQK